MILDIARKLGPGRLSDLVASARQRVSRVVLPGRLRLDVLLVAVCAAFGGLAAVNLKYALIGLVVTGLSGWVLAKPQVAAYLLILLTPLIVSVNSPIALLRPNEALIALFGLLIAVRWVVHLRTGERLWPKFDKVDVSLLALGLTSSAVPLLMMLARQRPITSDDLLYSIVIWKLAAEYVIVRSVIKTREQAMRCLWLSLISAAIVCLIGIVQSLGLHSVSDFLVKYYTATGSTSDVSDGRGSSLLSLPAAVADLAILNLGIVIAMMSRFTSGRKWLAGLAVLFVLAVVAAAEFSTVIALVVAVFTLVVLSRSWRLLAYAVPVAVIGGALLWPVISLRLAGFHSASGLPVSWETRLSNLRTYFWPQLFSQNNWILGVRPSARVAAPNQLYGYVWIESGYTWLLWGGGIPLIASYLAFAVYIIRKGWAMARRPGPAGIAATAIVAATAAQLVSMIFDPHLTYRGSGDAFFLILGLVRMLPGKTATATGADKQHGRRNGRQPVRPDARGGDDRQPGLAPQRQEVPA
jgi:hypothetical protein